MELKVLKNFLCIARCGSIIKASEELHIAQPALSKQISNLEDELGIRLFNRTSKGVLLTAAGEFFKSKAIDLVSLSDSTLSNMKSFIDKENLYGKITIGIGELEAMELISSAIYKFNKIYKNVKFELDTTNSDNIKEKINNGIYDLGIVIDHNDFENFNAVELKEEEWGLLVSKTNERFSDLDYVTPEALKNEKLIYPNSHEARNALIRWLGRYYDENNFVVDTNLMLNSASLVALRVGSTLGIIPSINSFNPDKFKFLKLNPSLKSKSYLIFRKNVSRNILVDRFLELVYNELI